MIRQATERDFDSMIDLGRRMHAESWYAYLPYDIEKIRAVLARLVTEGYAGVYEQGGRIEGYLLGVVSELWFCRELCAADLALFVNPDRRGGIAAARLIADFNAWALSKGVAEQCLAVSTGIKKEATGQLYEHFGFTHVGGVYKKRGARCAKA